MTKIDKVKIDLVDKYFNSICGQNQGRKTHILNLCYDLIFDNNSKNKIIILFGSGNNGKSVFTNLLNNLLEKNKLSIFNDKFHNKNFNFNDPKNYYNYHIYNKLGTRIFLSNQFLKSYHLKNPIKHIEFGKKGIDIIPNSHLVFETNYNPNNFFGNDIELKNIIDIIHFEQTFSYNETNSKFIKSLQNLKEEFKYYIKNKDNFLNNNFGINYDHIIISI